VDSRAKIQKALVLAHQWQDRLTGSLEQLDSNHTTQVGLINNRAQGKENKHVTS
jgi:hypothetical protein